jgi:hypothetical protein
LKAEGVGLVGSVLIITGRVVTAGVDEICRSEGLGWVPCRRTAEEPQFTGTAAEDAAGAASGACAGSVRAVEVELAAVVRPGNMTSPGVDDLCEVGTTDGA